MPGPLGPQRLLLNGIAHPVTIHVDLSATRYGPAAAASSRTISARSRPRSNHRRSDLASSQAQTQRVTEGTPTARRKSLSFDASASGNRPQTRGRCAPHRFPSLETQTPPSLPALGLSVMSCAPWLKHGPVITSPSAAIPSRRPAPRCLVPFASPLTLLAHPPAAASSSYSPMRPSCAPCFPHLPKHYRQGLSMLPLSPTPLAPFIAS
jgi:hypothetical protein